MKITTSYSFDNDQRMDITIDREIADLLGNLLIREAQKELCQPTDRFDVMRTIELLKSYIELTHPTRIGDGYEKKITETDVNEVPNKEATVGTSDFLDGLV